MVDKIFYSEYVTRFKSRKLFFRYYYTEKEELCYLTYNLKKGLEKNNLNISFKTKKSNFIEKGMNEYFLKRKPINLPFIFLAGTEFQKKVWHEVAKLRLGETSTYHQIAKSINRPLAYRAVGSAVGKNPLSLVIPCHRILHSGKKKVGKYGGGEAVKKDLLDFEGVDLSN